MDKHVGFYYFFWVLVLICTKSQMMNNKRNSGFCSVWNMLRTEKWMINKLEVGETSREINLITVGKWSTNVNASR